MNFIISTDTCCDKFKSDFKKNNVYFFGMKYNYNDSEYVDDFNSEEDYKKFYEIQNSGNSVKTSGVNIEEMKEYFTNLIEETKKDIIHLSLSSGLSCTYQNSKLAADEINETSNHKVYVVDSLSATIGMTLIVDEMIKLRDEEKTIEETLKILENLTTNLEIYFFLNDLETLKKGGRISAVAMTVGKALQLKPVLSFDEEGKLEVLTKVIGEKKAVSTLIDKVVKNYDGQSQIYVVYGENKNLAMTFKTMIEEKINNKNVVLFNIGPMICAHTGPSLLGLCFQKKH